MLLNDIIKSLEAQHSCIAGCFIKDAKTNEMFALYNEGRIFKSASLIKTPSRIFFLNMQQV